MMLDLMIQNANIVRPYAEGTQRGNIGIREGKIAYVGTEMPEAKSYFDAAERLAFPGVIDAHTHIGIYQSFEKDAPTETASAVSGGVTCMLHYVRTGSLYLNQRGSWKSFFPALLQANEGHHYCDYGFHVSPIQGMQIPEMEWMVTDCGCPNFGEVFMFYGSHGLHGRTDKQHSWLMLDEDEQYDIGHFDLICREAASLQKKFPDLAELICVSWHCETPEILRLQEQMVRRNNQKQGLAAYSAARPPHSEAVAIQVVGALAHAAGLTQVNILHITSKEAMEAALAVRALYPEITFGLEVTAGHLLLDDHCPLGALAKVNPPLRSPEDKAYLWEKVLDGTLEWVMTDHANCPLDIKVNPENPTDVWQAKAGFGGTEFLLPGIFSEGLKRGLSLNKIAALTSGMPAKRFGLSGKGDIAVGKDADIALLDPNETWIIQAANSFSAQGYSPFEGLEITGKVKATFVRGQLQFHEGKITGNQSGLFVKRPG